MTSQILVADAYFPAAQVIDKVITSESCCSSGNAAELLLRIINLYKCENVKINPHIEKIDTGNILRTLPPLEESLDKMLSFSRISSNGFETAKLDISVYNEYLETYGGSENPDVVLTPPLNHSRLFRVLVDWENGDAAAEGERKKPQSYRARRVLQVLLFDSEEERVLKSRREAGRRFIGSFSENHDIVVARRNLTKTGSACSELLDVLASTQSCAWADRRVSEGVSIFREGGEEEALVYFDAALGLVENHVGGLVGKGAVLLSRGSPGKDDLEASAGCFRKALAEDPSHAVALRYLKIVERKLKV